jgi:hypothetical protein
MRIAPTSAPVGGRDVGERGQVGLGLVQHLGDGREHGGEDVGDGADGGRGDVGGGGAFGVQPVPHAKLTRWVSRAGAWRPAPATPAGAGGGRSRRSRPRGRRARRADPDRHRRRVVRCRPHGSHGGRRGAPACRADDTVADGFTRLDAFLREHDYRPGHAFTVVRANAASLLASASMTPAKDCELIQSAFLTENHPLARACLAAATVRLALPSGNAELEPDAVQQHRHATQRVTHTEPPNDQVHDPLQSPPLILDEPVRSWPFLQRRGQRLQLDRRQAAPPCPTDPSKPAQLPGRPAIGAATRTPRYVTPVAARRSAPPARPGRTTPLPATGPATCWRTVAWRSATLRATSPGTGGRPPAGGGGRPRRNTPPRPPECRAGPQASGSCR